MWLLYRTEVKLSSSINTGKFIVPFTAFICLAGAGTRTKLFRSKLQQLLLPRRPPRRTAAGKNTSRPSSIRKTSYVIRIDADGNFACTLIPLFVDFITTKRTDRYSFYTTIFPKTFIAANKWADECYETPARSEAADTKPISHSSREWTEWEFIALQNEMAYYS